MVKAIVSAISLCGIVFIASSPAQAQCAGSPDQCRNCRLIGQPMFFFPGDPGPEARTLQIQYAETGPFLATPAAQTNVTAQMGMDPPPPASSELLAAAMLETMGYCEGPITFSQVGDGGTVTTNFGPCGTLTDLFTVVSDGTGTTPYQIQHMLSGNLTLQNLPALGPEIDRSAAITIGSTTATGEVAVYSGSTRLCVGSFSGSYTAHPTVSLPWSCTIRSPWTSFSAASNIASGTVARRQSLYGLTSITPNQGPTTGGTAVSLCGPGICTTIGVTLGGASATNLACSTNATCPGPDYPLLATTPAHAAGAVDVVATNGSSNGTLSNGYTYLLSSVPAVPAFWLAVSVAGLGLVGWWARGRTGKSRRSSSG
jgi:hypothetical protein